MWLETRTFDQSRAPRAFLTAAATDEKTDGGDDRRGVTRRTGETRRLFAEDGW